VKIVKAKLIERIKRTPTVESFRFIPEEKPDFIAGQFLQLILDPANPNNKELNKYLSFSSSPTKNYIEVTKRLSESRFSQALKNLKVNDQILINAPLGACVFKDEYKGIGFLIGGIGITPVISIIEYIAEKGLDTDVCLIYSNRTEEEIAFKPELDSWRSQNIKIHYVITESQAKENNYIFGRIDNNLVKGLMPDLSQRILFIFGPPKMVEAMQAMALELKANPQNLKTESFLGY
jgi:ferredoxin-NADP reductase